ncbi:hypothetical protein [Paracoccus marcusii]|uniref:hypothetical protein n=1 Tax=Paracoccus marcusii TaxID=59779 RepID=UPI0024908858|nr:hypothetical protein [Paracoccus marcusii]
MTEAEPTKEFHISNKDMEKAHSPSEFSETNRLITFSFCSALFGFLFAVYLGAFSVTAMKEIPAWISAMAAAASTGISGLAVYLVAGTLKATVATLQITKEMAVAQSEAYGFEFRPQILPDEVKILSANSAKEGMVEVAIRFSFRNYGKLAALRVSGQVMAGDVRGGEVVDMEQYTGFWGIALFQRSTLRPDGTFNERVVVRGKFENGLKKLLSPRLQYDDEKGSRHFDIEKSYYFLSREGDSFSIKEVGPFEITPHAGYYQGDMDDYP